MVVDGTYPPGLAHLEGELVQPAEVVFEEHRRLGGRHGELLHQLGPQFFTHACSLGTLPGSLQVGHHRRSVCFEAHFFLVEQRFGSERTVSGDVALAPQVLAFSHVGLQ